MHATLAQEASDLRQHVLSQQVYHHHTRSQSFIWVATELCSSNAEVQFDLLHSIKEKEHFLGVAPFTTQERVIPQVMVLPTHKVPQRYCSVEKMSAYMLEQRFSLRLCLTRGVKLRLLWSATIYLFKRATFAFVHNSVAALQYCAHFEK